MTPRADFRLCARTGPLAMSVVRSQRGESGHGGLRAPTSDFDPTATFERALELTRRATCWGGEDRASRTPSGQPRESYQFFVTMCQRRRRRLRSGKFLTAFRSGR
jgi:hypothetical protein